MALLLGTACVCSSVLCVVHAVQRLHVGRLVAKHVPPLLAVGSDVIVTYDEGTTDLGASGSSGGGHVFAVEAGPGVPKGVTVTMPMNHYSLLAGIEQRFHLAKLRGASGVTALPI